MYTALWTLYRPNFLSGSFQQQVFRFSRSALASQQPELAVRIRDQRLQLFHLSITWTLPASR